MENARPRKYAEPSAPDSLDCTQHLKLTLRQRRVLEALIACDDWLSREAVDRIAGASNGPQIIMELRHKVTGYAGIEMQRVESSGRDGKACKPGRYRLTPAGRKPAHGALAMLRPGPGGAHGTQASMPELEREAA